VEADGLDNDEEHAQRQEQGLPAPPPERGLPLLQGQLVEPAHEREPPRQARPGPAQRQRAEPGAQQPQHRAYQRQRLGEALARHLLGHLAGHGRVGGRGEEELLHDLVLVAAAAPAAAAVLLLLVTVPAVRRQGRHQRAAEGGERGHLGRREAVGVRLPVRGSSPQERVSPLVARAHGGVLVTSVWRCTGLLVRVVPSCGRRVL